MLGQLIHLQCITISSMTTRKSQPTSTTVDYPMERMIWAGHNHETITP